MHDKPETLDYANPRDKPPRVRGRFALRPLYCFLLAMGSSVAAIGIGIASSIAGPSNPDFVIKIVMIVVLLPGLVASLAGIVSGARQYDRAEGSVVNHVTGCLFGILNAATTILLAGMLIEVCQSFLRG